MDEIAKAVEILRRGGLVAFPTETVYGLGADAGSTEAVRRLYAAKQRPHDNPTIVHVADAQSAQRYAASWPEHARRLAERFWPGPLTLVLPRSDRVVPEASAGRDTVGLRCPDHPLALALLRAFDGPVAAPSANRSTRVSPTTAQHVREELGDAVDLILDGGPCRVGIESTVLDLSGSRPTILRPGAITQGQIQAQIGPVNVPPDEPPRGPARSPGMQELHYAPRTPAWRFTTEQLSEVLERSHGGAVLLIGPVIGVSEVAGRVVEMPSLPEAYARCLYSVLREMDRPPIAAIFIEMPPDEPAWAAVRDRLRRATRPL